MARSPNNLSADIVMNSVDLCIHTYGTYAISVLESEIIKKLKEHMTVEVLSWYFSYRKALLLGTHGECALPVNQMCQLIALLQWLLYFSMQ